jgi:hypothetical protein
MKKGFIANKLTKRISVLFSVFFLTIISCSPNDSNAVVTIVNTTSCSCEGTIWSGTTGGLRLYPIIGYWSVGPYSKTTSDLKYNGTTYNDAFLEFNVSNCGYPYGYLSNGVVVRTGQTYTITRDSSDTALSIINIQ